MNPKSAISALFLACSICLGRAAEVEKFGVHEVTLEAKLEVPNPYTGIEAEALLERAGKDGPATKVSIPLFWDGGNAWKFRFSPNQLGEWKWTVRSKDSGLNGKSGNFSVVSSTNAGSIRAMREFPHHFEREDGTPFWFMGDTAWALFTDSEEEKHNRKSVEHYLDARAAQGFNAVHAMLLSEAGWGNSGGAPFEDLSAEQINPRYWQEVDHRVAFANRKGIIAGLVLAWGDKEKTEPYAWRRFPSLEARKRYARYIAARYSAAQVYFIVSGEWHGEVLTRPSTEADMKKEFVEIGASLEAADPHERMIGIHPMTSHGSVREYANVAWMSFGDYQQNYIDLHGRILQSRSIGKPVVNSEYAYFLRDANGDGSPDKENSTKLEYTRHATWDILMGGGYFVTGFGTTYFGGFRDPGPFDVDALRNDPWEAQVPHCKKLFESLDWWKLAPHDELVTADEPRGHDGQHLDQPTPPRKAYWCLAEPGRQYVVYVRGVTESVRVSMEPNQYKIRLFNPRTGQETILEERVLHRAFEFPPLDAQDWLVIIEAIL